MKKPILAFVFLLALVIPMQARAKYFGYAEKGGKTVKTASTVSYELMETYPNCLITVYNAGTLTLATIYSDNMGTVKSNPFNSNPVDASYFFYIDDGAYDIKFSGLGIITPFTIGYVVIFDSIFDKANDFFISANKFPGANICAKINAAMASVAGVSATIYAFGGGDCQTTQIRVTYNHHLILGEGTYFSQLPNYIEPAFIAGALILLDSDSSVSGQGWNTIIKESTVAGGDGNAWKVIMPYAAAVSNGSTSRNIHVKDLQIQGAKPSYNSAGGTVDMANCHTCTVTGLYLNATKTIGIHAGGSPTLGSDPGADLVARGITTPLGRFAHNVIFADNFLYNVASQNLAVVNGRGVHIRNNYVRDPGQDVAGAPGVSVIDIEPNQPQDMIEDITIQGNTIDNTSRTWTVTGSTKVNNGIVVQNNAGAAGFKNVAVLDNKVTGAAYNFAGEGINGSCMLVRNNAERVRVSNNIFARCQYLISLDFGAQYTTVVGNTLISGGFNAATSLLVADSSDNRISSNVLTKDVSDIFIAGLDTLILETGTSNRNIISNNTADVAIIGADSLNLNNASPTNSVALPTYVVNRMHIITGIGASPQLSDTGRSYIYHDTITQRLKLSQNAGAYFNILTSDDWRVPGTIGSTTPNTGVFTTLTANTSLNVNAGTPLLRILSSTASLNYAQALANTCETLTITVTGVADDTTWTASLNPTHTLANHNTTSTFTQWISAANTISVRRCVITADGSDPAAAIVRADARKY